MKSLPSHPHASLEPHPIVSRTGGSPPTAPRMVSAAGSAGSVVGSAAARPLSRTLQVPKLVAARSIASGPLFKKSWSDLDEEIRARPPPASHPRPTRSGALHVF